MCCHVPLTGTWPPPALLHPIVYPWGCPAETGDPYGPVAGSPAGAWFGSAPGGGWMPAMPLWFIKPISATCAAATMAGFSGGNPAAVPNEVPAFCCWKSPPPPATTAFCPAIPMPLPLPVPLLPPPALCHEPPTPSPCPPPPCPPRPKLCHWPTRTLPWKSE